MAYKKKGNRPKHIMFVQHDPTNLFSSGATFNADEVWGKYSTKLKHGREMPEQGELPVGVILTHKVKSGDDYVPVADYTFTGEELVRGRVEL